MIERDKPKMVVSENGSELTGNAVLTSADETRVEWHYIAPRKPMHNAFVESFRGPAAGKIIERDAVHVACSSSRDTWIPNPTTGVVASRTTSVRVQPMRNWLTRSRFRARRRASAVLDRPQRFPGSVRASGAALLHELNEFPKCFPKIPAGGEASHRRLRLR
jgi:transposase InsO family protein